MKIEYCEILGTERSASGDDLNQILVGTITLKDGKLSSKAEKGSENKIEMDNIMKRREGEDPTKWFKRLPEIFDGAALRARLLKKGDRPWKRVG
jgi:hypothetical protein